MTHERILLVDDKVEIITFLTDLLQPLGYNVSFCTSGSEGVTKALQEQPDLILLDLNMPGMSGMEVIEALHKREFQSPIILMTLFGSESIAVQAFRMGVRNYIAKPFDINELLVAIDWALAEGRLQRERDRLLVELAETNQKLARRMEELSALQVVGHSVASLMPREELLRRILDAAVDLAQADVGAIFLWDKVGHSLQLAAVRQGEMCDCGLHASTRDSHAEDAFQTGQPLWIARPTKHTGVTGYLGTVEHSLLYMPIAFGDQVIGVVGVACLAEGRTLSTEIQSRLAALADYAAIALTNLQLYEDSQLQAQRLATVNHIAQTIASTLDLEEIMRAVARTVKHSLNAEAATLALWNEERGELTFEVIQDNGEKKQGTFLLAEGQGIVGWVVQRGQSLRICDVRQDARFYPGVDEALGFRTRSVLCVPLVVSNRVIGAIEAINKVDDRLPDGRGWFTAEDEELLQGVAASVAVSVENARLHAAVRQTIAGQVLHDTVVTLSHYVNNPLQTLLGAADLLKADLGEHETAAEVASLIRQKAREISVAISVLQEIASPESTVYLGSIQMLDIEKELQSRLAFDDSTPEG